MPLTPASFSGPGGHGGANPLDAAGCQITVHGLGIFRCHRAVGLHPELISVDGVGRAGARHRAAFAFADGDRAADTGDDISYVRGIQVGDTSFLRGISDAFCQGHFKDSIPVFLIPVDDMGYEAF